MTLRHDDQSVTFKVGDTKTFSYNIIELWKPHFYLRGTLVIDLDLHLHSPCGGSDFLMKEIDAYFLKVDDSIPPGVDGIYDFEGDTVYLEELLSVINSDPNLPPSPVCEINVPKKSYGNVKTKALPANTICKQNYDEASSTLHYNGKRFTCRSVGFQGKFRAISCLIATVDFAALEFDVVISVNKGAAENLADDTFPDLK
ncbi:hypothetical protein Tco_1420710 [Tanacetum coccineum]